MTDLKLSFDTETMLRLTSEQFSELSTTGETITDFAPAKDYWIEEEFSRLFLSFDNSLSDYFFEFEAQEDIDKFTKNSYLTHFFPKTGKIKLIKDFEKPLFKLLLNGRHEIDGIPMFDKSEFNEQPRVFYDKINEDAEKELIATGNFKGQISCCECGDGGCSSEYLWAEENYGLASFHILAAELKVVRLYPFKLA